MNEEEIRAIEHALADDTKRYLRAKRTLDDAGKAAIAKALTLLRAGLGPSHVARLTPFTDSYVRKAARDAGIPAARPPRGASARKGKAGQP